jgi:AcrR family transcriptional regulator
MLTAKPTLKAEETATRILDASLDLFRNEGFDGATMRAIAAKAGVATGAAYYYYPSKEAIVLAFYQRSWEQMQPAMESAAQAKGLEARLRGLIGVKLEQFTPNRAVLRALLRNGADPGHPLSPFSERTREIRAADVEWFRRILTDCGIRIPRDLEPHLPGVLWFFQMGVIFFWVVDSSLGQAKTRRLLDLAAKSVVTLIRVSALPFLRPLRKTALELIQLVEAD